MGTEEPQQPKMPSTLISQLGKDLDQIIYQIYEKGASLGLSEEEIDDLFEGAQFQYPEKLHRLKEEEEEKYKVAETELMRMVRAEAKKGNIMSPDEIEAKRKEWYRAAEEGIKDEYKNHFMVEIATLFNQTQGSPLALSFRSHRRYDVIKLPKGGL